MYNPIKEEVVLKKGAIEVIFMEALVCPVRFRSKLVIRKIVDGQVVREIFPRSNYYEYVCDEEMIRNHFHGMSSYPHDASTFIRIEGEKVFIRVEKRSWRVDRSGLFREKGVPWEEYKVVKLLERWTVSEEVIDVEKGEGCFL